MPDIDTEELRRQGIALTYLETQRVLDALDAKDREIERLREIENVYEQDQHVISDLHRKVRELAPYRKRAHDAEAKLATLEASEAGRG